MSPTIFRKVVDELERYPELGEINISGFGEPLLHGNFLDFLYYIRRKLKDCKITIITNATLIKNLMERMYSYIDKLCVSIDSFNPKRLESIRRGLNYRDTMETLEMISKFKRLGGFQFLLATVVTRDNIGEMVEYLRRACQFNVDEVFVTNIIAYSRENYERRVYTTIPEELFPILKDIGLVGDFIKRGEYDRLFNLIECYAKSCSLPISRLNIIGLLEELNYVKWMQYALEVFDLVCGIAREEGVTVRVPLFHSRLDFRRCPYIEDEVFVIRWDGRVYPCLLLMYSHLEYVNAHSKYYYEYSLGSLVDSRLDKILNGSKYLRLKNTLTNIVKQVPTCNNCPFAYTGCIFVKDNILDCLGNTPSCSECLYSYGIVQCP